MEYIGIGLIGAVVVMLSLLHGLQVRQRRAMMRRIEMCRVNCL